MTQTSLLNQASTDQRLIYGGITWQQFKLIQAGFAESPGVRLFYYNDAIEILMPGRKHEVFSRLIGFLIGLFCLENNIEFEPTGSMTQEREGEVSVQADESYCFGESKPTPDLAIEVVFTSGGPNKLQRYEKAGEQGAREQGDKSPTRGEVSTNGEKEQGSFHPQGVRFVPLVPPAPLPLPPASYQALGVPEVWFWQDGLFSLYHLRDTHYEKISRSEIPELATLDLDLLTRCVLIAQTSRLEAATAFRNALKPT